MWIWLDKTGRVKQYLTHGPSPVVGETDFQIFAYFEGLDLNVFDTATIKFRKPDRQKNAYPALYMKRRTLTFVRESNDSALTNFVEGQGYQGFLFDFSDFAPEEDLVRLLDTPGLWQATITCLGSPNKTNVSGLITFTVGGSASDDEEEAELSIDQVLENLVLSASLLKKDSNSYLRVATDFVSDATDGRLDPEAYSVGSTVFDLTTKNFYKVLTITPHDDSEDGLSATYEKAYSSVKVCDVTAETTLEEAMMENDGSLAVFRRQDGSSLLATFEYENEGSDIRFDAMDFVTGNRYAGTFDKDTPFLSLIVDVNMVYLNDKDGLGRVIHETYETKAEASALLAEAKSYADDRRDKFYSYHNDQGQDTWVIDHNLGKMPSVTIVADADGREIIADVEYVSSNRLIIHFQSALNGSAYLN